MIIVSKLNQGSAGQGWEQSRLGPLYRKRETAMSILRVEGFEKFSTGAKAILTDSSSGYGLATSGSRWGYGQYLTLNNKEYAEWRFKKTPGGTTYTQVGPTVFTGFAFKIGTLTFTGMTSNYRLITYWYASGGTGHTQCSLVIRTDGKLELRREYASGTTDGSSSLGSNAVSTNTIAINTCYYIECKINIGNPSTDSCIIRVNGVDWITLPSGANTKGQTSYTYVDSFGFGDTAITSLADGKCIDDVYVIDPSSGTQTTFLGDCRVETLSPTAAGSTTQWTHAGTGTGNWGAVAEDSEDGDVSYNTTSGVGNRDTYALADLSASPTTIHGIQQFSISDRDAGETNRQLKHSLRSGGSYYDHADAFVLPASYTYLPSIWSTDPATGVAFTVTGVNALEAGIKLGN